MELTDTADDGRPVRATVSLDVVEATDQSASVDNGDGVALEHLAGRLHGDAPPGNDQGVTMLHRGGSIRIAPDSASAAFLAISRTPETAVPGSSVVSFHPS